MDIEGAEVDALQGRSRLLAKGRPAFLLAVHGQQRRSDCEEILRRNGYSIEALDPGTLLAMPL